MARKPNPVPDQLLQKLRDEIRKCSGLAIQNPVECEQLSDLILRKTKFYLSPSTLKRLMGFYKNNFFPSYQTLNITCLYCGYDGWQEFINPNKTKTRITTEELEFFKKIFFKQDYYIPSEHDEAMQTVTRRIAERLREDPKVFESLVPELAKNPLVQIFYFEHFPDYDNLVSFHYKGYMEYLKYKKTSEAQIFGNCLLFFRAFLMQDKSLMHHYYQILTALEIPDTIHPMPLGRYYQCAILYRHFIEKKSISHLLKQVWALEKKVPRMGLHFKNFPGFHYFVADALILSGYYQEAIKLIEKASKEYKIYREFVWKGYYRHFQLMLAEAHFALGKIENAKNLIRKINPEKFYFISKMYFTIRFNILKLKLSNKKDIALENITLKSINNHGFKAFLLLHEFDLN